MHKKSKNGPYHKFGESGAGLDALEIELKLEAPKQLK